MLSAVLVVFGALFLPFAALANDAEKEAEKAKQCREAYQRLTFQRGIWALQGIDFDTDDRTSVRNARAYYDRMRRYCGWKEPENKPAPPEWAPSTLSTSVGRTPSLAPFALTDRG